MRKAVPASQYCEDDVGKALSTAAASNVSCCCFLAMEAVLVVHAQEPEFLSKGITPYTAVCEP